MSTQTTNYKFIKAELSDPANITMFNGNWDTLEELLTEMGAHLTRLSDLKQNKITYGTSTPSGGKSGDVYIQLIE